MGHTGRFSVLYQNPAEAPDLDAVRQPDYFGDLNLDQFLSSLLAGRDEYHLEPIFSAPLRSTAEAQYRHEILRDLEDPDLHGVVTRFAASMRTMRERLERVDKLYYPLQKQSWFVDAVEVYCRGVRALATELPDRRPASRGLRELCTYLTAYVGSPAFTTLQAEASAVKEALAAIRYAIRLRGDRVSVSRYDGEPEYSTEVLELFARFRQGEVESHLTRLRDTVEMNHVEAQVLDRVARLYPEAFGARSAFCERHRDYPDPTVVGFDREVQFYLAYLELVARLRAAGLPLCYPQLSSRSKDIAVDDAFDIALADKAVPGTAVITNDIRLSWPERAIVISGPNNGGKTTFARMFGQLHHLGALGLLVPGRSARLFLPDRIFTHFERAEDIETLRGKFDDELVRVRDILTQATPDSVIVMNESFNSTSLSDALLVGTEVMRRILDLGCLAVYVTFVDEIASLDDATVSMVSQIVPDNPAERTFKVIRASADGRAYASAIADKYGLSYARLMERVGA